MSKCPNSSRRVRPDFVGDPGRRQSPLGPRGSTTSPRTLSGRVGSSPCPCSRIRHGPGQTLSLVWSGLVGSLLNPTTRTRPDMSAPATRSPTKSGPCQTPLHAPTDFVCDPTRPDQTHGRSPYMSTTRQGRRTCRRPKRSVGPVRSVQWNLDVTRRVRRLQRN